MHRLVSMKKAMWKLQLSLLAVSLLMMFSRMRMRPRRRWASKRLMVLFRAAVRLVLARMVRPPVLAPQRTVKLGKDSLAIKEKLDRVLPVSLARMVLVRMVRPVLLKVRMARTVLPVNLMSGKLVQLRLVLLRPVVLELVLLVRPMLVSMGLAHNLGVSLGLRLLQVCLVRQMERTGLFLAPVLIVMAVSPHKVSWPQTMVRMGQLVPRLCLRVAPVRRCLTHILVMRKRVVVWPRWRHNKVFLAVRLVLEPPGVFPVRLVKLASHPVLVMDRSLLVEPMDRRVSTANRMIESLPVLLPVQRLLAVLPPVALPRALLVHLVQAILQQLRLRRKDRSPRQVFLAMARRKVKFLDRVLSVRLAAGVSLTPVKLVLHVVAVSRQWLVLPVPLFKGPWLLVVRCRVRLAGPVNLPQVLAQVSRLSPVLVPWLLDRVLVRLAAFVRLRLEKVGLTVWGRLLLWVRLCLVVLVFPVAERPVYRVAAELRCLLKADRVLVLPRLTVLLSKARLRLRLRMSLVSCRRQVRMVLFLQMNLVWLRNRPLVLLLLVRTVNGRLQQRERHMPVRLMLFVLPAMAAHL